MFLTKKSETFFVSWKQKLVAQQMFPVRANGETFRDRNNNVSSFAGAFAYFDSQHNNFCIGVAIEGNTGTLPMFLLGK